MAKEADVEAVVTAVKRSKKYGATSEATIRELAEEAVRQHKKTKAAVKAVRARLHSIMAPYLGDPDYALAAEQLEAAFAAGDDAQIEAICLDCLGAHLSTRERLPILFEFYERIFAITGRPHTLMDIACGLNPLALRWMGLDGNRSSANGERLKYYAYDIHEPRIDFINHYFALEGLKPLARVQDVAGQFPQEEADVALFLKEMPRFERNYGPLGRPLLEALNANYLILSYPSISTHGGRNLTNRYREFMHQLITGHDWPLTELLFEGELVFVIEKAGNR
jgi:16S rRNA (guanine(1405)-N(7))-methyltransferase